jgi:hypothetical protein
MKTTPLTVFLNAQFKQGEGIKNTEVGNECRFTRCPFEIWSVYWSPIKMVCLSSHCADGGSFIVCMCGHFVISTCLQKQNINNML